MKQVLCFFSCVMMLACTKEIPVNLSGYDTKRLVAEGKITNEMTTQEFKITWTSDLGTLTPETADDVQLSVTTPSGVINYTSMGNGQYLSEIPFAGVAGESYTISLTREGKTHSVTTLMPGTLSVDSVNIANTAGFPLYDYPSIFLKITSSQKQYFRYDVFKLVKDQLPDSVWLSVEVPVYEAFPISSGQQEIILNQVNSDLYQFDTSDVAKVFVYAISYDVYSYLGKLKSFMTAEPKGGKFENPPYYYSNEAYGLGYGTAVDSALYVF